MRRETSEEHWSWVEYEYCSMSVLINAKGGDFFDSWLSLMLLDSWLPLMSTSSGFHSCQKM
jgi:hypothetical protein